MKLELPTCDDKPVWDTWLSVYHLPAIAVADELGIFSALKDRPGSGPELAERLHFNERAVSILLPLLAALDFLACRGGRYHITDTTRNFLLGESEFYWGNLLGRVSANLPQHEDLRNLIQGEGSRQSAVAGRGKRPVDGWESGRIEPDQARAIAAFMHSHSMAAAVGAARNGDFSGVTRLLDVGGGSGCFSIALAREYPELKCTVMELPAMCEVAQEYVNAANVQDRVDTIAVDMFRDTWPGEHDAVFFSNIFHDWDFDTCAELAAKAFSALQPNGRVYLHEMLLDDDGAGPVAAATFSLVMLLGTWGRQFTYEQLKTILENAGFSGVETMTTYSYYSLTSARR
ncbi:MAG: methyltransferase [Gammaproteobacteria bacterium]